MKVNRRTNITKVIFLLEIVETWMNKIYLVHTKILKKITMTKTRQTNTTRNYTDGSIKNMKKVDKSSLNL